MSKAIIEPMHWNNSETMRDRT